MAAERSQAKVDRRQLAAKVQELAEQHEVPGVAAGVFLAGEEHYAFQGVTSVDNPLPVDESTLFAIGSTGKTFTATAIMQLVEKGRVDLNSPVRTYLPELRLKDEKVAGEVTVLHLLNHTAGWQGDFFADTGHGDDALARYVEKMVELEQEAPLGRAVSYNNASLSLAGRVIEKVTGQSYESAVAEMIFRPLGLQHTFFFPRDIMTRRFAVGHTKKEDGSINVARPYGEPRGGNPAGANIASTAGDQIAWARFHLEDGRASDGTQVLSEQLVEEMQRPTVDSPGSALGDHIGISWMLRNIEDLQLVSHGGSTVGLFSEFVMVPEREFALTCLTNCGPGGPELNDDLLRWALEAYLGVVERELEPVEMNAEELAHYTGTYETIAAVCEITGEAGGLVLNIEIRPDVLAQLREQGEELEETPPLRLGLLPGSGDRYVVTEGPGKGMKGSFLRGPSGAVESVHIGGRLATRTSDDGASVN
jgi:CubicO group peptidase (beta-lactamase class C family)